MARRERSDDSQIREALRVSQLDAAQLDSELFEILRARLESAFKYLKSGLLTKYSPEVNAALRYALWQYSVNALEATIGQKLLELRYKNVSHPQEGSTVWMTQRQKWLYAICLIGGSWLQERKDDISVMLRNQRHGDKMCKVLHWLLGTWKVAALINFLVFLTRGHYLYLIERLLGIRAVYPSPKGLRQIGFEYMDRELLWHGFAEFLFFVLPLINFNKMKNLFVRHLLPSSGVKSSSARTKLDYKQCAICGLWPYSPQQIGCRHIFCYYCIQSNYLADEAFCCPVCGQGIISADVIKPVQIMEQTDTS